MKQNAETSPPFNPPLGFRNPHLQTIVSSLGRKALRDRRAGHFIKTETHEILSVLDVKLAVDLHLQPGKPLVILISGWLGNSKSTYVLSTAMALHDAGYSVARLNLRDHGGTAHLNEGMFNSALIDEVVEAVRLLADRYGSEGTGLVGFSLGGNFALRVSRRIPKIPVLAVCPAIDPATTMSRIDASLVYQRYFMGKWRRNLGEKQTAFPKKYNFTRVADLATVEAMTDYFVRYHSDFATTDEYFSAYDLRGDILAGANAHILAAADDPIIPPEQYETLPRDLSIEITSHGGHGAYLQSWSLESWLDGYAVDHFSRHLL